MHTLAVSALALALSSTPALADFHPWWTLNFEQGIQCTGTHTGQVQGPGETNPQTVCVPVPDYGFTSAVDWSVTPSSQRSFSIGLHKSLDCGGDGGKYVGRSTPECINLEGIKAISVTKHPKKRSVTGRRAVEAFFEEDDEADEVETPDLTDLPERDSKPPLHSCFTPTFALTTSLAAGAALYQVSDHCPLAKDSNVESAKCGISVTFSVMLSLVTGFSLQGLYRHGDQSSKRDMLLPYENTTLVDGFSVSYTPVDAERVPHHVQNGTDWQHYLVHHHDLVGKHGNRTTIHSVHISGKNQISAAEEPETTGLMARQAPVVAYYSWVDGNVSKFKSLPVCHGSDAAENLAEEAWNYAATHNRDEICASLRGNGIPLNHGDYALIRGTYTDQSGLC